MSKKSPTEITDDELLALFDDAYENATERPKIVPGKALIAALRAVYAAGWSNAKDK